MAASRHHAAAQPAPQRRTWTSTPCASIAQSTGERVYNVNIINSKTTYQFDKHFLVRFLAQYDSLNRRFLTDLLASYEFVPGTVFHAGYGSLYEKRADANGLLVPVEEGDRYLTVNRGLFLKASYLKRF